MMHVAPRSIFELTLQALPDGVLLIDRDRRVVYANPAFAKIWSIPDDLLRSGDEMAMLRHVADQLVDPDQFARDVEQLHPSDMASEDELFFRDGRIVSRRSVPFHDDGEFQARIWIFTDITDARYALEDCLTGVKNRRAFSIDFPRFVERPIAQLKAVALLDVDNFKKYNDFYGHAAGDEVLRNIGHLLRSHVDKADDLLFRVGGEEFLIARATSSELEAGAFFETVRRSVEGLVVVHAANDPYRIVTASVGLKLFSGPIAAEQAFMLADKALYSAKRAGRNRVHLG